MSGGGLVVNRRIVVAVAVIAGCTIINHLTTGQPITRVIIGAYILLVVLSLLDLIGGRASSIAGMLAMLALVVVLLTTLGPLLNQMIKLLGMRNDEGVGGGRKEKK